MKEAEEVKEEQGAREFKVIGMVRSLFDKRYRLDPKGEYVLVVYSDGLFDLPEYALRIEKQMLDEYRFGFYQMEEMLEEMGRPFASFALKHEIHEVLSCYLAWYGGKLLESLVSRHSAHTRELGYVKSSYFETS